MHSKTLFKQDFLKKWVLGLQYYGCSTKEMSISERTKAIKLSSDVAMASCRDGKTCWSRAVITDASKQGENKSLVRKILGNEYEKLTKYSIRSLVCNKRVRSKKILRKSRKSRPLVVLASTVIAKRMVNKRTRMLKDLVPGGDSIDDSFLLEETLDYILSLKAQVDVMRRFVSASESLICK
ncbi:hypothetical protein GIB67_031495 [Kingdonia uniflora]|uniref:IBH1-like N-terminal domain-containing protein n=1 Tax=Kingdonia uniflora TaxID=39325 RepID=A0A7J7MNH4_9MAGN|nr:hypothetical protein GIB67_031495 [Kingdonia uniflora]